MEDNEVTESSESSDSTSTVESSESQPESTGAETQEASPEAKQEAEPAPKEVPFHEHPRWIERQEEVRTLRERNEKFQQDMYRLQAQLEAFKEQSRPKQEPVKDPFLADLEKVNPAYAKSLEPIYAAAQQAKQLEQRLAQFEQAQFAEKAVSHFNNLLNEAKITDPMDRKIMERAVRAEVYEREARGEKLNLKDLEKITKDFHAEYKNSMEARERAITAKYTASKKADVTPKGATGGIASTPGMKKFKAGDIQGQAKWLAEQVKAMKKEH